MKFIITVATAVLLVGTAMAQVPDASRRNDGPPLVSPRPSLPDVVHPSGEPGAPNRPLGYGETYGGGRVNPDRVPPTSPGGQGAAPESR
jgi:hypothetical protein